MTEEVIRKYRLEDLVPPVISDEEKQRLRNFVANVKVSERHRLSESQWFLIAGFWAKYHLLVIYERILEAECDEFLVELFCDNLRLFECHENGEKVLVESLTNYDFSQDTLYKIKYGSVIDSLFDEPIVEKSWNVFSYPLRFKVVR